MNIQKHIKETDMKLDIIACNTNAFDWITLSNSYNWRKYGSPAAALKFEMSFAAVRYVLTLDNNLRHSLHSAVLTQINSTSVRQTKYLTFNFLCRVLASVCIMTKTAIELQKLCDLCGTLRSINKGNPPKSCLYPDIFWRTNIKI